MPRFAVLKNGVVDNVIMAETVELAEEATGLTAVASEVANIGEVYNEEDGTFFEMPAPIEIEHPPVEEAPADADALPANE